MRSEQEILDLIVTIAKNDTRIRAVIMNGSRLNPNAPRDPFQDFDIVYLVNTVDSFTDDPTWIHRFGELMILQMPEAMQEPPPQNDGTFAYLMLFSDGNRIDLSLVPIEQHSQLENDSLSLLLLDKDGLFEPFAPPSDSDYLPIPPTARLFSDCCNEFWWGCPNVAKGLWREELPYAKHIFEQIVREQLMYMLTWYIGMNTHFTCSPGKYGKYLNLYLEPELWDMFLRTYSDAGYDRSWQALETMCDLFRLTATRVAMHFGFAYPQEDDEKVRAHLHHVRFLAKDASEIY